MNLQPPHRPPEPTPPLLALQVLRAMAALLVLVHHAGFDADTIAAVTDRRPFALDSVFDWGFGIHLFFVISGYIMARTARGFGSIRGSLVFLTRRIIRIVPLYWLMTSLVLAGALLAPQWLNVPVGGLDVVLGSYGFVPVVRPGGEIRPVLGQGWTLDYEMFFYVLFALSMLLPRRLGLGALSAALVGLVVLGWVRPPDQPVLAVWTDGLLLEFLFGLATGLAQDAGLRLPGWIALVGVLMGSLSAVAFGPLCACTVAPSWLQQGGPAAVIVGSCMLGPAWRTSRGVLALAAIGDASYSLYLCHPFVVRMMREAWLWIVPPEFPLTLYLMLSGAAAVAAGLLLHHVVEAPMTAWLQARNALARSLRRPILPESGVPAPGSDA